MKKTLIGLLGSTVICVLFLAGCIDEHYGEDSNAIVTNLTGYAWERTFQIRTEDGRDAEVCEHYEFGLNGKASCKSRTTCDGEEVEEHVHYFRYDFITPNNRYLLLDYCYWQIDRISSSVLSIYETSDNPVIVMGQTTESVIEGDTSLTQECGIAFLALLACVIQFVVGKQVGGMYADRISAGQALGQKNTVLAIWMACTYLNPASAIAPGSYVLWQNVINSWQLWKKRVKDSREAKA